MKDSDTLSNSDRSSSASILTTVLGDTIDAKDRTQLLRCRRRRARTHRTRRGDEGNDVQWVERVEEEPTYGSLN